MWRATLQWEPTDDLTLTLLTMHLTKNLLELNKMVLGVQLVGTWFKVV